MSASVQDPQVPEKADVVGRPEADDFPIIRQGDSVSRTELPKGRIVLLQSVLLGLGTVLLVAVAGHFWGWLWAAGAAGVLTAIATWKIRSDAVIRERLRPSGTELLEKLTNQLPVMVYQFRTFPTGRSSVTFANDAIRTIYEIDREAAKADGGKFLGLVHPDDRAAVEASLRHSYFTLEPWAGEYRVVLPKAGVQWRFAQALVERLPDGGTLWHGFVADITDKKLAEESQRHVERTRLAREKSEESDRAKTSFLAMMSHELRTPMNSVLGFLDLLRAGPCTPEQSDYLQSARTAGDAMLALMDDLLELARIDGGDVTITQKEFDLFEWIRGIEGVYRPKVAAKGLEWRVHLSEGLPRAFCSDRLRLSQCLFGLLENALKFTSTGHVALRVSVQEGMTSRRLRFDVEDTGIGIPPGQLERLFEPFARGDESTSRRFGGMGLGLPICQSLCGRLGGTLTARSEPGAGSTFSIEIRLPHSEGAGVLPVPVAVEPPSAPAAALNLHVLIAEDQKTNQRLLGLMLRKLGCSHDVAGNGRIAVEMAATGKFDVILMDIQMPELDGMEATRIIRRKESEDGSSVPLPIIAVTANAFDSDREEYLACGMNDFIAKPVLPARLAAALAGVRVRRTP